MIQIILPIPPQLAGFSISEPSFDYLFLDLRVIDPCLEGQGPGLQVPDCLKNTDKSIDNYSSLQSGVGQEHPLKGQGTFVANCTNIKLGTL